MFEIEKNKPIPVPGSGRKYPLASMEVGDSFFMPLGDGQPKNTRSSLSANISRYAKRTGRKFTTRTANRNGEIGVRCWRIE